MVCAECEEKLSKVIVPDKWRDGARNTTGARSIGVPSRFAAGVRGCRICKQKVSQDAHYCQQCAFQNGICAMCGKSVADLRFDRRGGASGHKRKRVNDAEHDGVQDSDVQGNGSSYSGSGEEESADIAMHMRSPICTRSEVATKASFSASDARAQAIQSLPQSAPNPLELVENALARAGTTPMLGAVGAALGPSDARSEWITLKDRASGRDYFWNKRTHTSSWSRPAELDPRPVATNLPRIPPHGLDFIRTAHFQGEQPGYKFRATGVAGPGYYRDLAKASNLQAESGAEIANISSPPLWRAVLDESSGRTYYVHEKTQETRWSKPGSAAPPPPPPEPTAPAPAPAPAVTTTTAAAITAAAQSAEDASAPGADEEAPDNAHSTLALQNGPDSAVTDAASPPLWRAVLDESSGRTYYVHEKTQETRWSKPGSAAPPPPPPEPTAPAPAPAPAVTTTTAAAITAAAQSAEDASAPGADEEAPDNAHSTLALQNGPDSAVTDAASPPLWRAVLDESSGRTYYVHEKTQETRWSKPGSAAPPPPPPEPTAVAVAVAVAPAAAAAAVMTAVPPPAQATKNNVASEVRDARPEMRQRGQAESRPKVSMDATLPPNWVVVVNPQSTCDRDAVYYCHIVSREVRWEKPELN
eukprot:g588.t1